VLYFDGPPFGLSCPWLALGGLIFTGILMCWQLNGALLAGILFTTFISWIKFPEKYDAMPSGLVPPKFAAVPKFSSDGTAFALDFSWGDNTGALIGAMFTFLYLDFLGSAITFAAMGQMQGMVNDKGDIPNANRAFSADAVGTIAGGLLGSSALTTYVESAAAVKEGGRTGITALVCAALFFLSCFFYPWTGYIPTPATGPILILIGVVIFQSAVYDVKWTEPEDAIPACMTMFVMPFTSNIAYGIIAGWIAWVVASFVTFKLLPGFPLYQDKWPGAAAYKRMATTERSMFTRIPGWNDNDPRSAKFDADQSVKSGELPVTVDSPAKE
jgi:AGZA family xanthine/uracil permease-like MFS transporter